MFTHKTLLRIGSLDSIDASKLIDNSTELAKCSYTFAKGIDGKGQVQSQAEGGIVEMELSTLPSKSIIQWALNPRKYESGMIVFSDDAGIPLEKILFSDATCISMEITYMQTGSAYIKTSLVITAKKIMIGSSVFESRWLNK